MSEDEKRLKWDLDSVEGATVRRGKEKHLDKELEMPHQEIVDLHIPVLGETYEGLREVIEENGWEEEEGLRTLLAAGLGYIRARTVEEEHANGTIDEGEYRSKMSALRDLVAKYEAQYSVMKFKAYQFQEKSRILELRVTGLEGSEQLREAWMVRVRDRLEALEEEGNWLEEHLKQLEQGFGQPRPEEESALSRWRQRLRALWEEFASGEHGDEQSQPPQGLPGARGGDMVAESSSETSMDGRGGQ